MSFDTPLSASRFLTDNLKSAYSARQSLHLSSRLKINESHVPQIPERTPRLLALRRQLPTISLSVTCIIAPTLALRLLKPQTISDTSEVDQSSPSSRVLFLERAKPLHSVGQPRVRSPSMAPQQKSRREESSVELSARSSAKHPSQSLSRLFEMNIENEKFARCVLYLILSLPLSLLPFFIPFWTVHILTLSLSGRCLFIVSSFSIDFHFLFLQYRIFWSQSQRRSLELSDDFLRATYLREREATCEIRIIFFLRPQLSHLASFASQRCL